MKIVHAASEAAPFIKTGGLGDVMQALPAALSRYRDCEVSLFLPLYGTIKQDPLIHLQKITDFTVFLGWREQYVGLFQLKSRAKKKVYFIDNEFYFCRVADSRSQPRTTSVTPASASSQTTASW